MTRKTPLRCRTRLKPVSKKRQAQNAEYAKLRKAFLEEHPFCQVCLDQGREKHFDFGRRGCRPSAEVHHMARRGKFLLRTDTWLAVCWAHHIMIEGDGNWARKQGYLLTVEQRRKLA